MRSRATLQLVRGEREPEEIDPAHLPRDGRFEQAKRHKFATLRLFDLRSSGLFAVLLASGTHRAAGIVGRFRAVIQRLHHPFRTIKNEEERKMARGKKLDFKPRGAFATSFS
jgi:hypothetical protein